MLAFPVGSLAVKAAIGRKSLYDLTVSATPRPRNRFALGRREFSTLATLANLRIGKDFACPQLGLHAPLRRATLSPNAIPRVRSLTPVAHDSQACACWPVAPHCCASPRQPEPNPPTPSHRLKPKNLKRLTHRIPTRRIPTRPRPPTSHYRRPRNSSSSSVDSARTHFNVANKPPHDYFASVPTACRPFVNRPKLATWRHANAST